MNSVNLIGRLTRDPESRTVGSTTKVEFTIAVERSFKREGQPKADFIRCEAWGKSADAIVKCVDNGHIGKGRPLAITGRLEQQEWESDGNKSRTVVVVEAWGFVPSDKTERNGSPDDSDVIGVSLEDMPF